MRVPFLITAAQLPIQLPACGLGKHSKPAQSLGTLHPMADLEKAPGSWLHIGAAPTIATAWEVNDWGMIFLSVSLPFCVSDFLIKKKNASFKKSKLYYINHLLKRWLRQWTVYLS